MNKTLITILFVILLLLTGGFVYGLRLVNRALPTANAPPITPTLTPEIIVISPTERAGIIAPSPIPLSEWRTYRAVDSTFQIQYPPDVNQLSQPPNDVVFNKSGPTQTEGTELFDGYSIMLRKETYTQNTLQAAVTAKHTQIQNEPGTRATTPIQPVTVAGLTGFTFRVSGLGEFDHYYVPVGDNENLLIVTMVADPQNRGYKATVDQMLSTLTLTPES